MKNNEFKTGTNRNQLLNHLKYRSCLKKVIVIGLLAVGIWTLIRSNTDILIAALASIIILRMLFRLALRIVYLLLFVLFIISFILIMFY